MLRFRPVPDVNTEQGFMEAIAAQTGRSEEEIEALPEQLDSPDVQRGLTTDEAPALPERNEKGQFIKAEEAPEPEAPLPVEIPSEEEPEEHPPAAEAEPDYVKELRQQNEEAQKLIGRMGQELGELRKAVEEPEEEWEPVALPGLDDQTAAWVEERIASQGVDATLGWIAQNRPDLFEGALELAGDPDLPGTDIVKVARWGARYEMALAQQAAPQPQSAHQPDETVEQIKMERRATEAVRQVGTILGDEFAAVKPHILDAYKESPKAIQALVLSGDAEERAQGAQALAALSRARASTGATATAQQQARDQQVAAKQAAQVATGSQRPVPQRQPGEQPSVEDRAARIEKFHEELLGTETTNVQDGLTFGNAR